MKILLLVLISMAVSGGQKPAVNHMDMERLAQEWETILANAHEYDPSMCDDDYIVCCDLCESTDGEILCANSIE